MKKQSVSFLTFLGNFQIMLMTWRRGEFVGTDSQGNRYYQERKARGLRRRRWVMYNGEPEATRIPPEWFGWLHYTHDQPLSENSEYHQPWVRPHITNRSGSAEAYRPSGHPLAGGQRAKSTSDYQPWTPPA